MDEELERRASKRPDDAHPIQGGDAADPDPSDYADPRVAQFGEDTPGEDAMAPVEEPPVD